MKKIITYIFAFISFFAFSEDVVYIRTFAHLKINAVTFTIDKSTYQLTGDEKPILKTKAN
ncbi:MAG TPA: hypothetical protein PLC65_06450 [Bacteroidia bacterium]|nr:hypothetical protein [Bacteroidia bacterium]